MTVWYFARGRGRGHALAGLSIARHMRSLVPSVRVRFISYGTGARTFRELGVPVLDLRMPDIPGLFDLERKLPRIFNTSRLPALVVAHEEFAVCPFAKAVGVPGVLITDWFLDDPNTWQMESIKNTEEVLFLDDPQVFADGLFIPPPYAAGKVQCTGPVLRPLSYGRQDRLRARRELGIAGGTLVVSVFIHPGRRTEEIAPLREILQTAFDSLPARSKLLLWDRDSDSEFDRTMAASDLAITKGNRNIVLELAAMGIPSISVSHGLNAIDDLRTASLANNRTLANRGLSALRLAECMTHMIERNKAGAIQPIRYSDGARKAAESLAALLLRATSLTGGSEK